MSTDTTSPTWPELAIGLYDQLTSRGAEISYEFDNIQVGVPRSGTDSEPQARWKVDGTLRIRTREPQDV